MLNGSEQIVWQVYSTVGRPKQSTEDLGSKDGFDTKDQQNPLEQLLYFLG